MPMKGLARYKPRMHPHLTGTPDQADPLSEAEKDVLRLVARGLDNREIATRLDCPVHTVTNRLRTIFDKLRLRNRTEAALFALREGIARLDEPWD